MLERKRGKVKSPGLDSPTRVVSEDDFLKDKRSPSMVDMIQMYFLSTFTRKLIVAIVISVLCVIFFESETGGFTTTSKSQTASVQIQKQNPTVQAVSRDVSVQNSIREPEPVDPVWDKASSLPASVSATPEVLPQASQVPLEVAQPLHQEEEEQVEPQLEADPAPLPEPEEAKELPAAAIEIHEDVADPEDKPAAVEEISNDPMKAKSRWAQLEIPSACLLPGVLPTGVIAGLELYSVIPTDPPPSPPPPVEEEPVSVGRTSSKLADLVQETDGEEPEDEVDVKATTTSTTTNTKPTEKPVQIQEEEEEEEVQPVKDDTPEEQEEADTPEEEESKGEEESLPADDVAVAAAGDAEEEAEEQTDVSGAVSGETATATEEMPEEDEEAEAAAAVLPHEAETAETEEEGAGELEEEEGEGTANRRLRRSAARRMLADRDRASKRDRSGSTSTRVVIQREMPAVAERAAAAAGVGSSRAQATAAARAQSSAAAAQVAQANLLAQTTQPGGAVPRRGAVRSGAMGDVTRGTYNALNFHSNTARFHQVEVKALNILRNITAYESHCQFASRECAQESAKELANLLRLNAQAVSDADTIGSISSEMQRVSQNLAGLRSNTRMTMNQTALESLGMYGALGKCAVVGRGEFDDSGNRFDTQVSRFAQVIDAHDTMVYCSNKAHKCIFSSLNEPNVKKVEVDYKSWMSAYEAGKQIHELLAKESELGGGVLGWGHTGDPTITFTNFIVLLRSGLCERVDIYGETERPAHWLKVVGNGHLVSQPGPAHKDWELAVALQQERFVYRMVSNSMGGKMCFFQ